MYEKIQMFFKGTQKHQPFTEYHPCHYDGIVCVSAGQHVSMGKIYRGGVFRENETPNTIEDFSAVDESLADGLIRDNTTPGRYVIYPIPHEMTYAETAVDLSGEVNLYYEDGIDEYTRACLEENLDENGISAAEEESIAPEGSAILLGIYGSGGAVDRLAADKADAALFRRTDSYLLYTSGNKIIILGKDADSAYYGVTTLRQMLEQKGDGNIFYGVTVKDYSDIAFRGFIEGYYGNPWSLEDRVELMKFGGDYKMNQYIYAPKDDPYHNSRWRELYPDSELPKIEELAKAGNESKCSFVFAIHPFMNNAFDFNNYEADLATLKARYTQAIEHGVRSIAILEDDSEGSTGENLARLLNDLHGYLVEMKETYPDLKTKILYCPSGYMGNGSDQKLKDINASVGDDINIMMTGGRVWGEVSTSFGSGFKNNVASDGVDGRSPYMWINWPCSDNSKQHLIMGGYTTFLHPGVNPSDYKGIVLNPMQQSEPSKAAIFGNADFAWNVWENGEEADTVWQDAFNFVDHGTIHETTASASLRELSKHMMNQNMDSRVTALEESVEFSPLLKAYRDSLETGTVTAESAQQLVMEFKKLQAASSVYRKSADNTRVRDQIIYWLNCWDDTLEAALNLIYGETAYDAGENDKVWDYYSAAQTAFEKSRTYTYHYVDHEERAEVGVQHIVPFIQNLMSDLGMKVSLILDPTKVLGKFITNRTDTPSGDITSVTDGDASTEIVYETPASIAEGTYVGILYNKPIEISKVKFEMGRSGNLKDTFTKSKLQYTEDGSEWTDVEGASFENNESEIEVTDLGLTAKGIRLTATEEKGNTWLGIREITVNDPVQKEREASVIRPEAWKVYQGQEGLLSDGDDSTFIWYQTPGDTTYAGDYIGLDMGSSVRLGKVRFVIGNSDSASGDKWVKYHLSYSDDMENWTTWKEYTAGAENGNDIIEEDLSGITARYVCMFNDEDKHCWVKFAEMSVEKKVTAASVYTNVTKYQNLGITEEDDAVSLDAREEMSLRPGEYVGLKLKTTKKIKDVTVNTGGVEDLTLQVSVNGQEWDTIDFSDNQNIPKSKYIRLINQTDAEVIFDLSEFKAEKDEMKGIQFMETTMGINEIYGSGDSRKVGTLNAMFDGNFDTNTDFCDYPEKDGYILYDLGLERSIKSIRACTKEGEQNYLRDGKIQVSDDLENWTDVAEIGDGVPNAPGDVQSADGWAHGSGGYYYFEGMLDTPVTARYLRVLFTAGYSHRFVSFNEITINGGEYVQETVDDRFDSNVIEERDHAPENMIDGDLTTTYIPGTKDGEVVYHLEDPAVNQITVIQKNNSDAVVSVRVSDTLMSRSMLKEGDTDWIELGTLDKSLTVFTNETYQYIYDVKIAWGDQIPVISEVMVLSVVRPEEAAITEALTDAQEKLAETGEFVYTVDTYQELVDAVNHLQTVYAGSRSTEKDFEEAIERYESALAGLKEENWYDEDIRIKEDPVKMKYMVDEEFDPTGMTVDRVLKASISNATRNLELEEDQYTYDYDFSRPGKQTVTVFYYGRDIDGGELELTDTLTVPVVSGQFYTTALKVAEGPKKIKYKPGEEFDTTGMKLIQVQKASSSNATRNEAVNAADCEFEYNFSEPGDKKVSISFTGEDENGEEKIVRTSVSVTVAVTADEETEPAYVTGIKVTVKPELLSYRAGSQLDTAGMVVTAKKMRNGKPYTVILGEDEYDCIYDFSTAGQKTVTVSYEADGKDGELKTFTDKFTVAVYKTSSSSSSGGTSSPTGPASLNGTWQMDAKGWKLKKTDGTYVTDSWTYAVWQNETSWYHFNQQSYMDEGWFTDRDGSRYYLHDVADGTRGFMYTGWRQIDGKWYYFNPISDGTRGALFVNGRTPDGYTVDTDGAWIQHSEAN